MYKKSIAMVLAAALAAGLGWYAYRSIPSAPLERVTVADAPQVLSALIYIAKAEGYFQQEGLELGFERYASGKAGLAAMLEGKADIAPVADLPVARALSEGKPVKIFAVIHTSDKSEAVAARRDRGIKTPADLIGKRIGVPLGTGAERFLNVFLVDKNLAKTDITIVPLAADKLAAALIDGSIDAMAGWQILRLAASKGLGDNLVSFYASEGLHVESWALTASAQFLATRPETAKKFLRALLAAESLLQRDQARAVAAVAAHTGLTPGDVEKLWDKTAFNVRLDQALLLNLEVQVQDTKTETGRKVDVFGAVYADALTAVNPARVTLVH